MEVGSGSMMAGQHAGRGILIVEAKGAAGHAPERVRIFTAFNVERFCPILAA